METNILPSTTIPSIAWLHATKEYHVYTSIVEILWIIGTIFNISFLLTFAINFFKRKSDVRCPYFLLVAFTTILRVIAYFVRFQRVYKMEWPGYGTLYEMFTNLSMDHHGIIIVALALNRATALIVPLRHHELWRWRNFIILFIFICVFPIIPNLFIIHLFHCYWKLDSDGGYCRKNFIGTHAYVYLSNLITPLIAFILNIIAIKRRYIKKLAFSNTAKYHVEVKLLYQSIFSTVLFTAWSLATLVSYYRTPRIRAEPDPDIRQRMLEISSYLYQTTNLISILYFEGGLIMLIMFSTIIRHCYFNFYGITHLIKKFKKITHRNNSISSLIHGG